MTDGTTERGTLRGLVPRERLAVSGLFLANGLVVGAWAPRIPSFKADLGIGEATLGLMILAFGLGSLAAMPLVGMILAREGSRRVALVGAFALAPLMLLITLAPGVWTAAAALALTGALVGGMDVAMNANAVSVERRMGRAIMSSCHGFWSLGGLIGAASGGVLIARAGVWGHAGVVLVAVLAVAALALPATLRDTPEAAAQADEGTRGAVSGAALLPAALLGITALFSMTPEGSVLDWSALYLRDELGGSVEAAGLAFAGFSATMALMRFSGDLIRDRLGAVLTLRLCTLVAGAGLLIAAFADGPAMATLGFAVAGLGMANMVPIAFSSAGAIPGLPQGVGISIVTFMGYSGLLFAPSLIGFVAEHTGLGAIFAMLPLLYVVVLALSGLARWADPAEEREPRRGEGR